MSSIFEKKWPSIICTSIIVANNVITVSDTKGLHPKQTIELLAIGQDSAEYEIKRVLSSTQLQIGDIGKPIHIYLNPIQFNGGTLVAVEQERNVIDANAGIRASYAEEPTVALRNVLVDYYGNYIASITDNNGSARLAVDTSSGLIPGSIRYEAITYEYPDAVTDIIRLRRVNETGTIVFSMETKYVDATKAQTLWSKVI